MQFSLAIGRHITVPPRKFSGCKSLGFLSQIKYLVASQSRVIILSIKLSVCLSYRMVNEDRTVSFLFVEFPALYRTAHWWMPGRTGPEHQVRQFGLRRGDAEYQLRPRLPCTHSGQTIPTTIRLSGLVV